MFGFTPHRRRFKVFLAILLLATMTPSGLTAIEAHAREGTTGYQAAAENETGEVCKDTLKEAGTGWNDVWECKEFWTECSPARGGRIEGRQTALCLASELVKFSV